MPIDPFKYRFSKRKPLKDVNSLWTKETWSVKPSTIFALAFIIIGYTIMIAVLALTVTSMNCH